ncbi:ATP-binding protein [Streptomyces sp. G-G2]|uniref:ATP-binding protein n=1 Tax=Streptomyces sp. G-G2 TaxID=3046201 RepID=UPI0024BB9B3E|nr:ATP-binding protein [Streptomyces sp. G-G2]MDJ0386206.1 ATP-binding protein [Streptomyces sp. G-G2]
MVTTSLREYVALPLREGSAALARERVHHLVSEAERRDRPLPPTVPDVLLLLVTELVTNALRHTDGPVALELVLLPDSVHVYVTDTSPEHPRARAPDLHGHGGWGWTLVNHLASAVEVRPSPEGGKTIHTRVPL